jgi:hypothetical protein
VGANGEALKPAKTAGPLPPDVLLLVSEVARGACGVVYDATLYGDRVCAKVRPLAPWFAPPTSTTSPARCAHRPSRACDAHASLSRGPVVATLYLHCWRAPWHTLAARVASSAVCVLKATRAKRERRALAAWGLAPSLRRRLPP